MEGQTMVEFSGDGQLPMGGGGSMPLHCTISLSTTM